MIVTNSAQQAKPKLNWSHLDLDTLLRFGVVFSKDGKSFWWTSMARQNVVDVLLHHCILSSYVLQINVVRTQLRKCYNVKLLLEICICKRLIE